MPVPAHELYDQHAAEFDDATNFEKLPEEFERLLDSFVDGLGGPLILDAGCGPGRDVAYFHERGLDPIGVDLADGMLEHAVSQRPGRYLKMDIRTLAFRPGSFDGIWCPASIFFMPEAEMQAALGEFRRVLRPDGVARIGFKLGDGPTEVEKWGTKTLEYHVSADRARALLESAGFRVESVSVNTVSSGRTFANFYCLLDPVGGEPSD
jgi:SAM-dependent methyltransferase